MTNTQKPSKKAATTSLALPWHPLIVIAVVVLVYFMASIIGELLSFIYPLTQGWTVDQGIEWMSETTIGRTVQVAAFYGAMVGLLYLFIKKRGIPLKLFGVVAPRLRDFGYALVAVVPYIAGYALLLATAMAVFPGLNTDQEQQLGFDPGQDPTALILTFISLVVLPPLAEEFTMRGFVFTGLRSRTKFVWAALITSVLFAAAHLQFDNGAPLLWVAAIDTFVLSLILCYLRAKTGSLWAGIFLHALKNGVAFASLFVFHLS